MIAKGLQRRMLDAFTKAFKRRYGGNRLPYEWITSPEDLLRHRKEAARWATTWSLRWLLRKRR